MLVAGIKVLEVMENILFVEGGGLLSGVLGKEVGPQICVGVGHLVFVFEAWEPTDEMERGVG